MGEILFREEFRLSIHRQWGATEDIGADSDDRFHFLEDVLSPGDRRHEAGVSLEFQRGGGGLEWFMVVRIKQGGGNFTEESNVI